MKDIGKNIKQLRRQNGMTQAAMAEALFVSRQTVSNYENGKSRPDVDMIIKIAEVLHTDANAVLYGPPVPKDKKAEYKKLGTGIGIVLIIGLLYGVCYLISRYVLTGNAPWQDYYFHTRFKYVLGWVFYPALFFFTGWSLLQLLSMFTELKPLRNQWAFPLRIGVLSLIGLLSILPVPYVIFLSVAAFRSLIFPCVFPTSRSTPTWLAGC